ncbi:hypothetical protein ACH4ZX_16890 [Streptomyces sp. NPDC020490]|uniref:hypothetical protein n=1 Tax=Streptomyces sp. NPDC020490 TaxID=3365078 RepID=UPI0037917A92
MTRVKLLYCGQGMTTLVEVYDSGNADGPADYLALVDCGGDDGGGAIEYIAGKVQASRNKRLDLIVISHQDNDHNELLAPLAARLDSLGGVTLGDVFLGGRLWGDRNKKTVKDFASTFGLALEGAQFNAACHSDYLGVSERSGLRFLSSYGDGGPDDVFVRVLVANLPLSGRADLVKNGTSAVVVVENGRDAVILPGDATYETMRWINALARFDRLLPTHGVLGMEIPHHGALRTSVERYLAKGKVSDFNWNILYSFAELTMKPKAIGASSGHDNSFHHPLEEVLEHFTGTTHPAPSHTYVSYGFTSREWDTRLSERAVYTTVSGFSRSAPWPVTRSQGKPFEYGDIWFNITSLGVVRPEEVMEFKPRGKQGARLAGVAPLLAPAP